MAYRSILPALALALALALAACGRPAAQEPPTVAPAPIATPEPTAAPAPTEAAAPTTAPAPTEAATTAVLPAPLLFTDEGSRLVRLDVDGKTVTTLAEEPATIIDFVVAPDAGTIAYVTVDQDQRATLVRMRSDGTERAELASGVIRGVTIAADGSVQAGTLFDTVDAGGQALQGGVWSFPADGGAPALLVASTEPSGSGDSPKPGSHYLPSAWSPDGSQLLLTLTMNMGPDGPGGDIGMSGAALYDAASGETRELLSLGQEPLCVQPAWSLAGDAIFCANAGAIGPPTPALWRLSLADEAQETLLPAGEPLTLVLAPRAFEDGLYVVAGASSPEMQRFMPQRIGPDGAAAPLLPEPVEAGYDGGLWAPDGDGIVVGRPTAGANRTLIWQPFGGGEPVELVTGSFGKLLWAQE